MAEKKYSRNGEWVSLVDGLWRVGLSSSSAADLGDATFVELPALGRTVVAGEAVCTVEAVKAAADFYSPIEGTVAQVNNRLQTAPQLLTESPEDEGWIFAVEKPSAESLAELMDEAAWKVWEQGV